MKNPRCAYCGEKATNLSMSWDGIQYPSCNVHATAGNTPLVVIAVSLPDYDKLMADNEAARKADIVEMTIYPVDRHSVEIRRSQVMGRLPNNPTREDIKNALKAEILEALVEDAISFDTGSDGDDLVEEIQKLVDSVKSK